MRPCFTFVFRWKEGRKEEGKNGETRAKRRGTGSATRPDLFLDDAPLQTPIPSFQSRSVSFERLGTSVLIWKDGRRRVVR